MKKKSADEISRDETGASEVGVKAPDAPGPAAPPPEQETPRVEETESFQKREEITPEQLLEDIRGHAREGSLPEAEADATGETYGAEKGEWHEESAEGLEHELGESAAENAKQTAKLLVEMLNGVTISATAAIAGVDAKQAEKMWAFTAREKQQLYTAALPVVKKYGVELPCEMVLALVIIQVEAPRVIAAQAIRKGKRAAGAEKVTVGETGAETTETETENEWELLK